VLSYCDFLDFTILSVIIEYFWHMIYSDILWHYYSNGLCTRLVWVCFRCTL